MSVYRKIEIIGTKFIKKHLLFKYGFNWSPMYRRSTAKIIAISEDLREIKIKLPISYKNRNYMNSIFGGSLFAAVDPVPMIQLVNLLGKEYVVWDKSAEIFFKRPAKEDVYAQFNLTLKEIEDIKEKVSKENEIEVLKITKLTDKLETKVYCEVHKTIYIAEKSFYKTKLKNKK